MNNIGYFIMGLILGVAITLLIVISVGNKDTSKEPEAENRTEVEAKPEAKKEKPSEYEGFVNGDIIEEKSFRVQNVLQDNVALVCGRDAMLGQYLGTTYLMIGPKGTTYYDDQIIKVPNGKVVRMNGTYKYETAYGVERTVPRIMIMNK